MRCIDYNKYSVLCLSCNFPNNIACSKEINLEKPLRYLEDNIDVNSKRCPTCGNLIKNDIKDEYFRCTKCSQIIVLK